VAALGAVCLTVATGAGALASGDANRPAKAGFDTRSFNLADGPEQLRRFAAGNAQFLQLSRSVPGITARWSRAFQTPIFLSSVESMLTPPNPAADPVAVVTAFVESYPALFRCSPGSLARTRVIRNAQSEPNGLRSICLEQHVDGVPVFGCDLRATLTPDGRIATIGSTLLDLESPGAEILDEVSTPLLALQSAARLLGASDKDLASLQQLAGAAPMTSMTSNDGPFEHLTIEPVYVPVSRNRVVRGHRLIVQLRGQPDRYEIVTIGTDPAPAIVRNLTRYAGPMATYRIYPGASPTPMAPASPSPNGDQPSVQSRSLVTVDALDPVASPDGWVDPALATTIGNNIIAQADFNGNNGAEGLRPDAGPGLVFDYPIDLGSDPASNIDAAITQAFYTGNWFHDIAYSYGFTEGFGAYQTSNFGRGGVEGDPISIDVQDGSAENNARFISTGADGSDGRVELFLWTGSSPARDSALDNHLVIHELTHGVTDRILLGITGIQGRGMAEGWSDYFALSLLTDPGADPALTYPFAPYVAFGAAPTPFIDNYYFGLRRFPYSTDPGINPLTFEDIDPAKYSVPAEIPINPLVPAGNPGRVHQVGELWCSALWGCRASFIATEGPEGAAMLDRLVVDSLKLLTTSEPDMVMARDAMLIADIIRFGGAHVCDLWDAFAQRGLGAGAFSPSSDLRGVVESFESPTSPSLFSMTAPGAFLSPGSDTIFRFGVDPGCADAAAKRSPVFWCSINNEPFFQLGVGAVSQNLYELRFPELRCGDNVRFYVELDTATGTVFLPQLGPAAPFNAGVEVDPVLGRIRADDRNPFDFFGFDVDIDAGVIVAGAWQDDDASFNGGAAYVFEPEGSDLWAQRAKLLPSSDEHSINFGYRVSISNGLIATSAIRDSTRAPRSGAVYVFTKDAGAAWTERAILTALDGEENDGFGSGLSVISDGTVYVGAAGNDTQGNNAGAVYAYAASKTGQWKQLKRLLAPDGAINDRFGEALAAEGDLLFVGAPGENANAGAVYCYRRVGTSQWILEDRITPENRISGAEFGISIDIDGDRIIVGAPGDDDFFQEVGVAYVFHRSETDGVWSIEGRLSSPSQRGLDEFGHAVTIDQGLAVVTALRSDQFEPDGGAAFAYERTPSGWALLDPIAPQFPQERIQFGSSVALGDGVVAVGAWLDGEDRSATGSVSLYRPVALDCDGNGIADACEIADDAMFDLDGDGALDRCQCAGDLNGDRSVNTSDLGVMIGMFGMLGTPADLNLDGVVDQADLGMLLLTFGQECTATP